MSKTINYEDLVQRALVQVVKDLLKNAAKHGLFGQNHFYITYNTEHPGVVMPLFLKEQYPDSMTIVIQYEFWDLEVHDNFFELTLSFNNLQEHLVVPFDAMTSFVDPSAKFGLQFTPSLPHQEGSAMRTAKSTSATPKKEDAAKKKKMAIPEDAVKGNVITLDAFRKK